MRFTETVDIDAPPPVVWQVMADLPRWPEWTESISSLRLLNGGELRPGLKARVGVKGAPAGMWTVTSVTSGREFAWVSKAPGMRTLATHVIEPFGDGARVTLAVELDGIGARLLRAFLRKISVRNLGMEAAGLKRASEAAASTRQD